MHNMLPILQTGDELRVVTDSPMREDAVGHLEATTGLQVSLSLSSPAAIREAIRQVYAMASTGDDEPGTPFDLSEALGVALLLESQRFGISVRGARARFWWEEDGIVRRRPLTGDWRASLEQSLSPSLSEITGGGARSTWEARLSSGGRSVAVSVDSLVDESGREILLRPTAGTESLEDRLPVPPDGIVSEIGLLARSGAARFIVQTVPEGLSRDVLPHLPALLLDPSWRSVYIHAEGEGGGDDTFSVPMPSDPATWVAELEALRPFHFDVVTVDLTGGEHGWAEGALDVASVAFLYWPAETDTRLAFEAGVRWRLKIERSGDDTPNWSLDPLNR